MDKVKKTFDKWADSGRSELMAHEHSKVVFKLLRSIPFNKSFTFLDIGCGNGWVVREIAQNKKCKKAVGIDKSKKMIQVANSKKESSKEQFVCAEIENLKYSGKFDYAFSMESLYYSESIPHALTNIYRLLKSNGIFYCGTDFYKENKATVGWQRLMKIPMQLKSIDEWKILFTEQGFKTRIRKIKDPFSNKKWKRELGTLFIIAKK